MRRRRWSSSAAPALLTSLLLAAAGCAGRPAAPLPGGAVAGRPAPDRTGAAAEAAALGAGAPGAGAAVAAPPADGSGAARGGAAAAGGEARSTGAEAAAPGAAAPPAPAGGPGESDSSPRGGGEGAPEAPGPPAQRAGAGDAQAVVIDRIAAVVNDAVITLSEVDSQVPRPAATDAERAELRREALDRLIEAMLVSQEAARENITVTEEEVDAEVAAVRERENLTEEELIRALAQEGLTLEEYRSRLRDNIRRAKVISRTVRGSITIPDATLRKYYEEHREEFTPPASYRLRLLLLPVSSGATDAEWAIVRAEAQALRLRAIEGEPFEALVREHSKGPAAEEGGDLGVLRAGQLDPRFEAAVRGLDPGEISTPVVIESGVALLQVVERLGGEPTPFEEVRDRIYRTLYEQEFEKALERWIGELKEKAAIEVKL